MTQIEELRIGNWVSNTHNIPMIVKAIYEDTVYVDFKGNVGGLWEFNKYEPFKPISLTEEILLNSGFEEVHDNSGYYELNSQVLFILRSDNTLDACIDSHSILNANIKYLHQLQNLYFCLVGEELNIEL